MTADLGVPHHFTSWPFTSCEGWSVRCDDFRGMPEDGRACAAAVSRQAFAETRRAASFLARIGGVAQSARRPHEVRALRGSRRSVNPVTRAASMPQSDSCL